MNAAELITEVGVDNIKVQFIDACADTLNWSAKQNCTTVKFATEIGLTPEGLDMAGMVVWMPRDRVRQATIKAKSGGFKNPDNAGGMWYRRWFTASTKVNQLEALLTETREYVTDALDAMEHSDGRDLLSRIDAMLSHRQQGEV